METEIVDSGPIQIRTKPIRVSIVYKTRGPKTRVTTGQKKGDRGRLMCARFRVRNRPKPPRPWKAKEK